MRVTFVLLLMSAFATSCGGRKERNDGARASPARGGPDDPLAEKLRHCPLTVEGAHTTIEDVDVGVALTVTADGAPSVIEIRKRAAHLVAFTTDQGAREPHGGGDGGGFMRNCPVVTRDTRIASADVSGGSRLVVEPAGALSVEELRTETRRRYDALVNP